MTKAWASERRTEVIVKRVILLIAIILLGIASGSELARRTLARRECVNLSVHFHPQI
jgi:hypothetical protein